MGDEDALFGGPPVTAMLIQNTNPANVAPEQRLVKQGFLRDDLFTCVHEQFMTDTAKLADVVLPATMFLEHDDIYKGGGNQHVTLGPKLIDPAGRAAHQSFRHRGIGRAARRRRQAGLRHDRAWPYRNHACRRRACRHSMSSGMQRWADLQPPFEEAHFIKGFGHPDGKYRFRPQWTATAGAQPAAENRWASSGRSIACRNSRIMSI